MKKPYQIEAQRAMEQREDGGGWKFVCTDDAALG